ncbi:MAG TPA: adenosyl-hopene transferase HpnH [Deltaproteobacteria bacterium]|nr:MAG: hopanoid biosynthesis associated radical SAM protein HpnH [Deltaproteobacteria bacterium GWA2_45_12]HBF12455.1 adenosyl-hopene transferase HpnH [Deltaproteobacteria bacterium]
MAVPLSQGLRVFSYVMKQKIKGVKRYPLVLMLEPLFRCNLECKGCGKIQFPEETLNRRLSVEECLQAAQECGAPMVSIPGGEPLIHPEIQQIVEGLIKQKRYIYLCTNALLLERKLHLFKPSKYLTFSVHLDGLKEEHDKAVCRDGVFEQAVKAIKAAKANGFRLTTNTTLFDGENPERVRAFFDFAMELGIEGMMVSPGYAYEKAPDQEHFLRREKTRNFFQQVFKDRKPSWKFNQSPYFLEFLMGKKNYQCTPWGNPTRNIFGWQKPCYLLGEGYAKTFKELMESTEWDKYGTGKNEKCADCMVHCGYEPTAVIDAFSSVKNFIEVARASV